MSHLRVGGAARNSSQYTYIASNANTARVSSDYSGCRLDAYPKWQPNQAGERTMGHLQPNLSKERSVSMDMFNQQPQSARAGQIIFDHGRPNDGYYSARSTRT